MAQRSADRVVLEEHISTGSCTSRGRIALWPTGPTTLLLDYRPADASYTATASMTRR